MFHVKHFQRIPDMPLKSSLALSRLHNPVSTVCACKKIKPSERLILRQTVHFCALRSLVKSSIKADSLFYRKKYRKNILYAVYKPCAPVCWLLC